MKHATDYMRIALNEAKQARLRGEVPVGAVIVDSLSGDIIAQDGNRIIEHNDPTSHAEILTIRKACDIQKNHRLTDCTLFVTLEPCPMCTQAIAFARIDALYFAVEDPKNGGVYNGPKIFTQAGCNHRPDIYDIILEDEAKALLQDFFQQKRLS